MGQLMAMNGLALGSVMRPVVWLECLGASSSSGAKAAVLLLALRESTVFIPIDRSASQPNKSRVGSLPRAPPRRPTYRASERNAQTPRK